MDKIKFENDFVCQSCFRDFVDKDIVVSITTERAVGRSNTSFHPTDIVMTEILKNNPPTLSDYYIARFHISCFKEIAGEKYTPNISDAVRPI